ncbi:MAG: hypothetical protein IH946_09835 [Bacteroidetes bacterium]|nr:hypothetical protein [Bacteroidota bacterium]
MNHEILKNDTYYYRPISQTLEDELGGGRLKWLVNVVKKEPDLDFQTGSNKSGSWISVYRGLTRLISIEYRSRKEAFRISGTPSYQLLVEGLYKNSTKKLDFKAKLKDLIEKVARHEKYKRYFETEKEGFFQSAFSRKFGVLASSKSDIVVLDKEAVIGHIDKIHKRKFEEPIIKLHRKFLETLSKKDAKQFGVGLHKRSIGAELDFLAVNKSGRVVLIEFKHVTGRPHLATVQLSAYYELFKKYAKENKKEFQTAIKDMLQQKIKLGLLPNWRVKEWSFELEPWIVISRYDPSTRRSFDKMKNILTDYGKKKKMLSADYLRKLRIFSFNAIEGNKLFRLDELTDQL